MTDSPCRFLEWDSDFFKRRIARVNGGRLTIESTNDILTWCTTEQIKCLYFLADCDDALTVRLAEDHGFHLVDIRVTLDRSLTGSESGPSEDIRLCRAEDVAVLKGIAGASYYDSRFYYDQHFSREEANALYETWVERSYHGYEDVVLVAESDAEPVGFMTLRLSDAATGQVGLIGVQADQQGKGLGHKLVESSLGWLAEREVRRAVTVTQGRNFSSQRMFQKAGFRTCLTQLWYHKWF